MKLRRARPDEIEAVVAVEYVGDVTFDAYVQSRYEKRVGDAVA